MKEAVATPTRNNRLNTHPPQSTAAMAAAPAPPPCRRSPRSWLTAGASSYLVAHRGGLCFRIRVPDDLRPCLGRSELRRSLQTASLRQARPQAMKLASVAHFIFTLLRERLAMRMNDDEKKGRGLGLKSVDLEALAKLSDAEIQELVALWLSHALDCGLEGYLLPSIVSNDNYEIARAVADIRATTTEAINKRDYHRAESEVTEILTMAGMAIKEGFGKTPPPDATTKRAAQRQYEKLADMVLRAKVAVAERLLSEPDYDFEEEEAPRARISIARQQDEIKEFQLVFPSDTPHDTGKTSARPTPQMMGVATSTATPVPPTDTPNNTPSLRDAVELYIEVKLPKWGPNTPRTYLPTLRQFVEIVEDVAGHPRLPLVNLSRELIREYCSVIARLPSRCDKPGLREKRYVEIARTMTFPPAERMKPWSIREKFNKTRGLINWLEIEYDGAINATRLNAAFDMPKVPRTRGGLPKSDRRYFSQAELEALFEPSAYLEATKESPAYFWAPLVALFSGMRITEICQLLVSDLREEDDIWLIDINGEGAEFKRLKSAAARRKVPVHPFLNKCLCLLEYA